MLFLVNLGTMRSYTHIKNINTIKTHLDNLNYLSDSQDNTEVRNDKKIYYKDKFYEVERSQINAVDLSHCDSLSLCDISTLLHLNFISNPVARHISCSNSQGITN